MGPASLLAETVSQVISRFFCMCGLFKSSILVNIRWFLEDRYAGWRSFLFPLIIVILVMLAARDVSLEDKLFVTCALLSTTPQRPISRLTNQYAMNKHWGVDVYLHTFLTSGQDGDDWPASCSGRFTLGESPLYPLDKQLDGPQSLFESRCEEKVHL
jgi:hypothetical protein